MSWGTKYIDRAEQYVGEVETPWGSNQGQNISRWIREAGYGSPVPWCGCFTLGIAKEIQYANAIEISHGYTGTIVARAQARGWLKAGGAKVPPGSLFVKGGATGHVGIVRDSSARLFETVEGNANHGVRVLTRAWDDGWQAVVFPDLGTNAVVNVTTYGFEDLDIKPTRYGGWPTRQARDERMKQYQAANPTNWVRPIRVDRPSPFAFEAGLEDTFGDTWRFGTWTSKAVRDQQLARYRHTSPAAMIRTFSQTRQGGGKDFGTVQHTETT
jgi:hypothetical protein